MFLFKVEFALNKDAQSERIENLQTELEKKKNILKDIKVHLKSAAERESELLREVEELNEKVVFLTEFPPGVQTEGDVAKHLQQTRLQNKRLEAEKRELTFELDRLREVSRAEGTFFSLLP